MTASPATIKKEFKQLPSVIPGNTNNHLFSIANKNASKNRYANVLPFDSSVVKMKNSSEYINANYITPTLPKQCESIRFISTQAPTTTTFETFWRMIWEHEVPVVLMLTKIMEKRIMKANCYWPSIDTPEVFDDIEATTISEQQENDVIIRKIQLKKENESRIICHLQYTGWPDHGTPKTSAGIKNLIDLMNVERNSNTLSKENDHIVVHCSAGIGRTGTFIAIYTALAYLNASERVNVKEIVENLREQRMLMVQTSAQYEFIYKVIEEYSASKFSKRGLNCSHSSSPNLLQLSGVWDVASV